ncbi:MAG: hypothetical protein GY953_41875 [bacterium]|nr:hypothetical protein [bacterium]
MRRHRSALQWIAALALPVLLAALALWGQPDESKRNVAGVVVDTGGPDTVDRFYDVPPEGTPPSRFGRLTSRRWVYGRPYRRETLAPVPNPNPAPEQQPRRDHPFDVAVSGDGRKVYVGLQGSELEPGSEVAVYDVARDRVVKRISLQPVGLPGSTGVSPYRLTTHPDGRYILVTNRFSNFASVIDTRTDRIAGEIPTDFYCQGVAFNAAGDLAYIANRYLDQVLVADVHSNGVRFRGALRELGGIDDKAFFGSGGIQRLLTQSCGGAECHSGWKGGFYAGPDAMQGFLAALSHVTPGDAASSRLLRAVVRTRDGGYADVLPGHLSHANGTVVFADPASDATYQSIARWIDSASEGPGVPVSNPRSKPKVLTLTSDERYLIVGNTGTQDISIIDTRSHREVGGIYLQNVVNDVKIYHSPGNGHDYLIVTTEGIGFGVGRERDPYGGESWDRENPVSQYSLWRDLDTARVLPKDRQEILGPFDAVDGTSEIKFRDIQNDLVVVDLDALEIPEQATGDGLSYLLKANKYEAHRNWVRYTSDTAESTYGDIKGDIPPELMRVVGALPERMVLVEDRVFVTMQGSGQVQELRIDPDAADPADTLTPVRVFEVGLQPTGIAAGVSGTPSAGKVFVTNFLSGSISVLDTRTGDSREIIVDPSVLRLPVPATNAERGEIFVHTAMFSSDADTSCFHCHYLDTGDGRPWGVSQVVGQEFLPGEETGHLIIGGVMSLPQMRGLFGIQPFFFEGVISGFEPRSMIMEHCPADDFAQVTPQGDFTGIEAHYLLGGAADVQSGMDSSTTFNASLEERRDEMFRRVSLRLFGKAFTLRDCQRFVGEWQIHEPRLLPNPYDRASRSVIRGEKIFEDARVGCASCHQEPDFTRKDFAGNRQQAFEPVVTLTVRDGAFTLIGMNRMDYINGYRRDLEPWDIGRAEEKQGHFTIFPLRGLWDRPPVFLHNGMARSLREVVGTPGHPGLRRFRYEPLIGGAPERPGRREVGFNTTFQFHEASREVKMHLQSGARLGVDTHGGTSHLTAQQVDDLVNFLNSIE